MVTLSNQFIRVVASFIARYDDEDVHDGLEYLEAFNDGEDNEETHGELKFVDYVDMDPCKFYYDASHLDNMGRLEQGWLRAFDRSDWLAELRSEYDRDFSHILSAYERNSLSPGISVNGEFGDGRGRSQFCYALGVLIKVARFVYE